MTTGGNHVQLPQTTQKCRHCDCRCVRYYMNFDRALALMKSVILKDGYAMNAANQHVPLGGAAAQDAVRAATTAADLYDVLKVRCLCAIVCHRRFVLCLCRYVLNLSVCSNAAP